MSEVPTFQPSSFDNTELLALPVLPAVLEAMLNALSAEGGDLRQLAEFVGHDAVLSARMLMVANSTAHRGRGPQQASLEPTLAALGLKTIRAITTTAAVYHAFSPSHGIPPDELDRFRRHALTCAYLARNLARSTAYPAPDEAYLAGLLHDLGRLFITLRHPTALQEVRVLTQAPSNIPALEQRLFGIDHCELGAALVESWRLSSLLADAIRFHHRPAEDLCGAHPLLRLLHVANTLSQDDTPGDVAFNAADRLLGLAAPRLRELRAEWIREIELLAADFGLARPMPSDRRITLPAPVELERTVRDLLLIDGACAELNEADEEPTLVTAIARSVTILFELTEIHLFLRDPQTGVLRSSDPGLPDQITIDPDGARNSLTRALRDRRPCHSLGDGGAEAGVIDRQLARWWGREGILCLPLSTLAETLGVCVAGITRAQLPRLLNQSPLLVRFGAEAARALDTLRQRELHRHRTQEDRRLLEQQHLRAVLHEVSNPLTIIRNYLHLLTLKLGEPMASEELRVLREETERISRILPRLAETEGEGPEEVGFNLNQTIRDLARVLDDALCRPHGIRLNLQLAEGLAPLARGRDAIRQVILNLLRNAVEALGQGGAITVTTQNQINLQGRRYVEMTVADDGPGLPAELCANLFQPLASPKGGGHAGLGLAIVRNLAEELGGYVGYRPNTQGGSVFLLLLPQP